MQKAVLTGRALARHVVAALRQLDERFAGTDIQAFMRRLCSMTFTVLLALERHAYCNGCDWIDSPALWTLAPLVGCCHAVRMGIKCAAAGLLAGGKWVDIVAAGCSQLPAAQKKKR